MKSRIRAFSIMRPAYLTVFFLYASSVVIYGLIYYDNSLEQPILTSEDRNQLLLLFSDFVRHIAPMAVCTLFGFIGAYTKNLIQRDERYLTAAVHSSVQSSANPDLSLNIDSQYTDARRLIYLEMEKNSFLLGGLFGIVGYIVLSSKIFVRLFYTGMPNLEVTPTFVGLAAVGMISGYFAREFAGASHKIIAQRLKSATSPDNETPIQPTSV